MRNIAHTNKHNYVLVRSATYISKHPVEVIDEQLMDSVRGAFLECVRAYYWTRVQKGLCRRLKIDICIFLYYITCMIYSFISNHLFMYMYVLVLLIVDAGILSRHSFVTRTLTASIDLGLETTNTPGLQVSSYIIYNDDI